MAEEAVAVARASYDRCVAAPDFFTAFYRNFFKRLPSAALRFTKTDMERQHKLLRHAIGLLLAYASQRTGEGNLLSRVASRHGREDLNIPAADYPHFVEALIETIQQHDPGCDPPTETAWRRALEPGIRYMQSRA